MGTRERATTNWYTPERTLISEGLSDALRKETYGRTVGGLHVCICCGMTLLFTMAECDAHNRSLWVTNTSQARCFEAGHIVARDAGGPDEPWNLAPLCHSCNVRCGRKQLFSFIDGLPSSWSLVSIGSSGARDIKEIRVEFERSWAEWGIQPY